MAMQKLSASIRTRPQSGTIDLPFAQSAGLGRRRLALKFTLKTALAGLLAFFLLAAGPFETPAQSQRHKRKHRKPQNSACADCRPVTSAPEIASSSPEDETLQKELAGLARALRNDAPGAYQKLSAFAAKNAGTVSAARAALALGYADYSKNRGQPALAWYEKAKSDPLLREYVLYWSAQAKRLLKRPKDALADLEALEREFPNTAMKELLVEALAVTAVDVGKPQEAVAALDSYPATTTKMNLLLERAHARQVAHQLARAAADYQTLLYKFPLSDEAKPAGSALNSLARELGKEYPRPTAEQQQQRAQTFFDAHKWREARTEFEKLRMMLPKDSNTILRQRADLRIAQARVQKNAPPSLIASVPISDPELDAERLYDLSQAWRGKNTNNETEMLTAIEQLAEKYPASRWTEDALMAEANYFWVQLERPRAAQAYKRVLDAFPAGRYTQTAEWRIAWVSYLDRRPEADELLLNFLEKYPASAYTPDALYWLGRNAEREGNAARARSFYKKDVERYPQTYFGHAAEPRLAQLGSGEDDPIPILDKIPTLPALRSFDEPIPAAVMDRWERAQALRAIAFDSSAELELKSAYFATASPRLLLEAAQAAFDQGHFGVGLSYGRLIVPSSEARKKDDVPLPAWKALYPLPYEAALRRESVKNSLDPMVVAGLIRQESTFQADAASHAGAIGLMQVLPMTGRKMAKQLHLRYSHDKLIDPEYNLTLGTVYLRGLIHDLGGLEQALAAYNAGEDRIAAWAAERKYEEIGELVESIPFTETREYVQIVLRNAEAYRMIYGNPAQGAKTGSSAPN